MDLGKTYIKMCEKAEEIQKQRNVIEAIKEAVGEYPVGKYKLMEVGDVFYTEGKGVHISFGIAYPASIWLPRQDQLQEMLGGFDISFPLIGQFYRYIMTDNLRRRRSVISYCSSMEQLWLAFVMKEKYNNIWNGEEWI